MLEKDNNFQDVGGILELSKIFLDSKAKIEPLFEVMLLFNLKALLH
jgi:hypothetical protein